MIPAPFEYHRPRSVAEALDLLQKHAGAKLLAGGHSLLPAMKLRLARPPALIDVRRLEELTGIRRDGDALIIGAGVTHARIAADDEVGSGVPMLAQAAALIGDVQVRNMGTIGGSIAHADPAADYPAALLAADAEVHVRGPGGERTVAAADFFVDLFMTALGADEIIVAVRVPMQNGASGAYVKFPHPASRFAVVGCAAALSVANGSCQSARVAFTGIAAHAFRDAGVEDALTGNALTAESIASAAARAADGVELLSDGFAAEEYRRHLARVYAARALTAAAGL